uniref:Insulin-like growth factor-binding protein 1 n=1 Tax=Nothoprocta perdicaria TaxID=30464 RepID=A0A8C7EH93_NOTPE
MPGGHSLLPWLLLLPPVLLGPGLADGVGPLPSHCAPCTPEKLAQCPLVAASCPETARQPGCGCCQTCALGPGQPCGVYTARCARGLRCRVPPEQPGPLRALLRGQGTCAPAAEADKPTGTISVYAWSHALRHAKAFPSATRVRTTSSRLGSPGFFAISLLTPCALIALLQGPCQKELYRALHKLVMAQQRSGGEIYKFYLPNCSKSGFYHSRQCETSLDGESAACWCVYPTNGKRIPGSLEPKGDAECQQVPADAK